MDRKDVAIIRYEEFIKNNKHILKENEKILELLYISKLANRIIDCPCCEGEETILTSFMCAIQAPCPVCEGEGKV